MEGLYVDIRVDGAIYADYFRYLFPPDTPGEPCKASISKPLGALIVAYLQKAILPATLKGEHIIRVAIPDCGNAVAPFRSHWLYITSSDITRLNIALKAEFDFDFKAYYSKGLDLGMMKKDIVEAFILSRGLISAESFDALHKRVYRQDLKRMDALRQKLLRKMYYIDSTLDTTGLVPKTDKK